MCYSCTSTTTAALIVVINLTAATTYYFRVQVDGTGTGAGPVVGALAGYYGGRLDTILSYVDLSTGRSPEGFSLLSAQVFGLAAGNCNARRGPCVRQAYFGGNIAAVEAVPAPPAIWLLGTAGLALDLAQHASRDLR